MPLALVALASLFLSTPSARRATPDLRPACSYAGISIHALREEGDVHKGHPRRSLSISIHALREEGDGFNQVPRLDITHFYPRPPRGGRPAQRRRKIEHGKFLSTPSARRATPCTNTGHRDRRFLSTPSARRATAFRDSSTITKSISIHALREEGDEQGHGRDNAGFDFYPRPPRGGRQRSGVHVQKHRAISIHALREEGDPFRFQTGRFFRHFYPRPPRGGRLLLMAGLSTFWSFLSTPSARRATNAGQLIPFYVDISIHALREEGDTQRCTCTKAPSYFYPRPPRGGRHGGVHAKARCQQFLSTPSARRATRCRGAYHAGKQISIHALREEGDPCQPDHCAGNLGFLSTPSARRATTSASPIEGKKQFLSTPSARRATSASSASPVLVFNFYPRPPRGGRR